jgi:hypothetical protein
MTRGREALEQGTETWSARYPAIIRLWACTSSGTRARSATATPS